MAEEINPVESRPSLDFRKSARRRPGMYIGRVGVAGVEHLLGELVSNCVDRFLARNASELAVRFDQGAIEVSDDGDGLPFDLPSGSGEGSLAEAYLTGFHQSRSADGHAPHIHLHGAGGAGLAVVCALSAWLRVRSWRSGNLWEHEFREGVPLSAPKIVERGSGRGTMVTYRPDAQILHATMPRLGAVRAQLFEAAHLFPGLVIHFERETFHAPNGLADLALIHERQSLRDRESGAERPVFSLQTQLEDVTLTVAALGETKASSVWDTWVNGSRTVGHGSHQLGCARALRKAGWNPSIVMLHAVMHDPRFAGPTKDRLEAPHVSDVIALGIVSPLQDYCRTHRIGRKAAPAPPKKAAPP